MTRPACLVRSASALAHNLGVARHADEGAHTYAVVKADAYGHGAIWAAPILLDAGAHGLGVACIEEAVALRQSGIRAPILLLEGAVDSEELALAAQLHLDTVIHCHSQLVHFERLSKFPGRVWVKVDTGMGRLGFDGSAVAAVWHRVHKRLSDAKLLGLMTHLSSADLPNAMPTIAQYEMIYELGYALGAQAITVANSAGLLSVGDGQGSPADIWTRPGLMLYGVSPFADRVGSELGLTPVGTFTSQVITVNDVPQGAFVGYAQTWQAQRGSRIAIVAAGYADGYPRSIANGTVCRVRGCDVMVAGRVSMDMLALDVTDVPAVERHDIVTLWGEGLPVETVASSAGTIAYELMCRVSTRVRRTDAT